MDGLRRSTMLAAALLVINFLSTDCSSFVNRYGTVKGNVTLTNKYKPRCELKYTRSQSDRSGPHIQAVVVKDGKPTEIYKDKVKIIDNDLFLSEAEYNDGGVYELWCGSAMEEEIKLKMFDPSRVTSVLEGEGLHHFCLNTRGVTDIKMVLYKILHNGSLEEHGSINMTEGPSKGFLGKFSLTDLSGGCFNLTIRNVNLSDQGCYVIIITGMYEGIRDTLLETAFQLEPRQDDGSQDESGAAGLVSGLVIGWVFLILVILLFGIFFLLVRRGCISESQMLGMFHIIRGTGRNCDTGDIRLSVPEQNQSEVGNDQEQNENDLLLNDQTRQNSSSSVKLLIPSPPSTPPPRQRALSCPAQSYSQRARILISPNRHTVFEFEDQTGHGNQT